MLPWQLAEGKGKYCSKKCMYKYRTRPSGLTYVKHKDNPTSFKPGEHRSPGTEFGAPGWQPWNKGLSEADPSIWLRKSVEGYGSLHMRLRRQQGSASSYACALADNTCKGPMHWSNISGRYESVDDFRALCQSHHERYDRCGLEG